MNRERIENFLEDVQTELTFREQLRFARLLVARFKGRFNTRSRTCGECGLDKYESLLDVKLDNQLSGAVNRIENVEKAVAERQKG